MTTYWYTSEQTLKLKCVSSSKFVSRLNASKEIIKKVYAHSSKKSFTAQRHIERYKEY